jgi:hypothetical protein
MIHSMAMFCADASSANTRPEASNTVVQHKPKQETDGCFASCPRGEKQTTLEIDIEASSVFLFRSICHAFDVHKRQSTSLFGVRRHHNDVGFVRSGVCVIAHVLVICQVFGSQQKQALLPHVNAAAAQSRQGEELVSAPAIQS